MLMSNFSFTPNNNPEGVHYSKMFIIVKPFLFGRDYCMCYYCFCGVRYTEMFIIASFVILRFYCM